MCNPHLSWELFLELQTKLKNNTTVDDASWGLEAALNARLEADATVTDGDVERAASAGSRRERHRKSLRRRQWPSEEIRFDGEESILQARQQLRIVSAAVTAEEWALLREVGEGTSYSEVAITTGASSGALRVRVRRLRQKVCALAA